MYSWTGLHFLFYCSKNNFSCVASPALQKKLQTKVNSTEFKMRILKVFFFKPDFHSPFSRSCNQLCCQSVWNLDIWWNIYIWNRDHRCILRISCHESALINDHSNDEDHEESEQMTNGRHLPKKFFFFGCASGAGEFMMRVGKKWYSRQF